MELHHREEDLEPVLRRKGKRGVDLLLDAVALSTREMKCYGEAARVRQGERVIERASQHERLPHPRGGAGRIPQHTQRPGDVAGARQAWIQAAAKRERAIGAMFSRIVQLDSLLQMGERGLEFA